MNIIGVIPARWGSSRFAGKVLANIQGKPMIQRVWEQAQKSRRLTEVLIACDDERVLEAVLKFKAKAVMTSPDHPSGTDRIAEAVKNSKAEIVVNIQGDEPLIDPKVIDLLAQALVKDRTAVMATVIRRIEKPEDLANPNVVKVAIDKEKNALYFSRAAIPFNRDGSLFQDGVYYKHLGLYAYRRKFLVGFKKLPASALEKTERLEQLRVLEAGYKIKTVVTTYDTVGVDTLDDLRRVNEILNAKGAR